jgi:integrase
MPRIRLALSFVARHSTHLFPPLHSPFSALCTIGWLLSRSCAESLRNTGSRFYRILREACAACDIPYGKKTIGGLVLHDARHTATTRMLQAGVDPATVGSITGHTDKSVILYYSHATADSRRKAVSVLEEFAGNQAKLPGRQTATKKAHVRKSHTT